MPFFVIFILVPLLELAVFAQISRFIGLGTTLVMCLITAILGGTMVRRQGLQTMASAQDKMRKGSMPSDALFDGLCIVAAGAMLITPGFITDIIGFSLLAPPVRKIIRKKISESAKFQTVHFDTRYQDNRQPGAGPFTQNDPNVIEAEYETVDEEEKR